MRKRATGCSRRRRVTALGAALARAEKDKPAAVAAIRLAALTGLRIGEVLAMRWEHVDAEHHAVVLPHTKTGRRVHGLPVAALELLNGLPRINGYVFTTGRDAAITYQTVHTAFATLTREAGLSDVRLHDLRRTVMTSAARAGSARMCCVTCSGTNYGDGRPLHPACRRGGSRGPGAHRCGHRRAVAGRVTAPYTTEDHPMSETETPPSRSNGARSAVGR